MDEATVTVRLTPAQRQWLNDIVAGMLVKGRRVSHSEVIECVKELMPVEQVIKCLAEAKKNDKAGN